MSAQLQDDLLTMAEVQAALRVNKNTLYDRVLPTLPTVTIGRRRLAQRSDVEAWVAARKRTGKEGGQ